MARSTIRFFNSLRTRQTAIIGEGADVQRVENTVILDYPGFGRGLNMSVPASRLGEGYAAFLQNFDVNERDQLVRVPGIVVEESFTVAGRTPQHMFVHGNPATGRIELVFIDNAWMGVRGSTGFPTTWTNLSLPAGPAPWVTCTHGDLLILSNGGGASAYYRQPLGSTVIALPWGPARALMSFAGRVFAGGVTDGGTYAPMGVSWTGATSEPNDLGPGSGFEELLDDTANGDQIIAMRSINFDIAAILTRNAVWIARRTGDPSRPADFSPVVAGYGAISDAATVRVPGGVAYLSTRDVIVFDGNTPRSISLPINSALFPLDTTKLTQYAMNYVESRNVLQLLVPGQMFEYSFTYGRWTWQTVSALRVVNTGTDFTSLSGAAIGSGETGGWGEDWGFSWGAVTGGSGGADGRPLDTSIYLNGDRIGRELIGEPNYFGIPFTPTVETGLQQAWSSDNIVSIRRFIIEYDGAGGTLQWSVPDANGDWQVVRNTTLPMSTNPRVLSFINRRAGKQAGLRVAITSGAVNIGRLQAEVEMRNVDRQGGVR